VVISVFSYQDAQSWSEKSVVTDTSGISNIGCENCITLSTASLQNTILDSVTPSEGKVLGVYLLKWQSIPGAVLPSDPLPTKQSLRDSPSITEARQQEEESKSDAT